MRAWITKWLGNRYGQAASAGLLLALAFPKAGLAGLAWVAPGMLLLVSLDASPKEAFRRGYVGGLFFWGASLYWLLLIPVKFFPILGWLAVCAYLAFYPAVWTWACRKLCPVPGTDPAAGHPDFYRRLLAAPVWSRAAWTLAAGVLWVALEMVRARLLTGFPWSLLGTSQYPQLPLVQLAQITGVYGISFLVAWTSVALALAGLSFAHFPLQGGRRLAELALPLLTVALAWAWGARECGQKMSAPPGPVVKVAMIQPSIPQNLIWDSHEDSFRLKRLIELSQNALTNQPDLLVWPEAAAPGMLRYDTNLLAAVTNLAVAHRVWLVIGSDDAEPDGQGGTRYFNSAFLVSPEGQILDRYSKRHLVMFGEYVPLSRWLPFLKKLTPVGDGFTPGTEPGYFKWFLGEDRAVPVRMAMLICFEDVMPGLVRRSVAPDSDFILNLTNDGWFRESAAQYQHAANAVFRAVENGRPLVRCTNNGRTIWVDAAGRIREMESHPRRERPSIYAEGWHLARIPLTGGTTTAAPFYARNGDWFGWGCVALAGAMLLARRRVHGGEEQ